ncbi:MAG: Ig-like domain-containing protein [Candidatus Krumholzibacteria bacterium]|nr:Ig-like domain-containing protein [Candidatus Krumholzibacteria bacterium]
MRNIREICWNISGICILLVLVLSVSCSDDPVDNEDALLRVSVYSGDNQTERMGAALPDPLVVLVADLLGDPREGVTVDFSAPATGAYVTPSAVTDAAGHASAELTLGSTDGLQTVTATITDDGTAFTATATTPECNEESLAPACTWPAGRIYITTTSSDLITGSGSVLIEFDPLTETHEKVLETTETIIDLAFNPRGDLFLSTNTEIFKVDPGTKELTSWYTFDSPERVEIEPNYGSVLTAVNSTSLYGIFCPSSELTADITGSSISTECLAVDPLSRDAWIITGNNPSFTFSRFAWDGRNDFGSIADSKIINTGSATPKGMCTDNTGSLYVVLDGSGSERSIGRMADETWTETFFDLYDYTKTGRWGDIAYSNGSLYLIDKWNNSLLVISTEGDYIGSYDSTDFSETFGYDERYGIAASPMIICDE